MYTSIQYMYIDKIKNSLGIWKNLKIKTKVFSSSKKKSNYATHTCKSIKI